MHSAAISLLVLYADDCQLDVKTRLRGWRNRLQSADANAQIVFHLVDRRTR